MLSKLLAAVGLATLLLAAPAPAATLTITPDESTYLVGETITLSVLGDAGGAAASDVFGRILFDPGLASWLGSSQVPLTSFGGGVTWTQGPLPGGAGFATAFNQLGFGNPLTIDGMLMATVTLQAATPGALPFSWETDLVLLSFFGLTAAPGVSVTIVPEPSTGLLLALGVLALAAARTGKGAAAVSR